MALITLTGKPRFVGKDGLIINLPNFPDKQPTPAYILEDDSRWAETVEGYQVVMDGVKRSRPAFRIVFRGLDAELADTLLGELKKGEITYYPRTRATGDDPLQSEIGFKCLVLNDLRDTAHIKGSYPEITVELESKSVIMSSQEVVQEMNASIENVVTAVLNGYVGYVDLASYPLCSTIWDTIADGGGNLRVLGNGGVEIPMELLSDFNHANRTGTLFFRTDLLPGVVDSVKVVSTDMLIPALPAAIESIGQYKVWEGYSLALHLSQKPGSETLLDSTENQVTVTPANMADDDQVYSAVSYGLEFSGSASPIEHLQCNIDFPGNDFVVEAVVKLSSVSSASTRYGVASMKNSAVFGSAPLFSIERNTANQWAFLVSDNLEVEFLVTDSNTMNPNQTYHLMGAFYTENDGTRKVEFFVDGSSVGSVTMAANRSTAFEDLIIGASYENDVLTNPFHGIIDEFFVHDGLPVNHVRLAEFATARARIFNDSPDLITLLDTDADTFSSVFASNPSVPWVPESLPRDIVLPFVGHINGKIYVAGGLDGVALDSLYIYDIATNTWTTGPSMPSAKGAGAYGVIGQVLYCVGGWNGSAAVDTNYAYSVKTNSWSTLTAYPSNANAPASAVLNNRLYVLGGSDGTSEIATVNSYNPQTDTWTAELPIPFGGRFRPMACVSNGMIFCGGGQNGGTGQSDFGRLIPGNSFSQLEDVPAAFVNGILFDHEGVIYAMGGGTTNLASGASKVVYKYDQVERWSTSDIRLRDFLWAIAGVKVGDIGYFIGGEDETGANLDVVNAFLFNGAKCPNSGEFRLKGELPSGWYSTQFGGPSGSAYFPTAVPGTNRRNAMCGEIRGRLIVVGGEDGSLYDDVYLYDPYQDVWKQGASFPTVAIAGGYGTYNNRFYVMGAYDGSAQTECYYYDILTDSWTQIADLPAINNLGGGVWHSGKFYLFHGQSLNLSIYDPIEDQWTAGAAPPATAVMPAVGAFNNNIYVVGDNTPDTDVYRYSITTNTWTTLSAFPVLTSGGRLFEVDGTLYYLHGNDDVGTDPESVIYSYNESGDSWSLTSFGAATIPVEAPGLVVHGKRVHMFGGISSRTPLTHVSEHQVYNFENGWL